MGKFIFLKPELTDEEKERRKEEFGRKPKRYQYSQAFNYPDCPGCGADSWYFVESKRYRKVISVRCNACGRRIR